MKDFVPSWFCLHHLAHRFFTLLNGTEFSISNKYAQSSCQNKSEHLCTRSKIAKTQPVCPLDLPTFTCTSPQGQGWHTTEYVAIEGGIWGSHWPVTCSKGAVTVMEKNQYHELPFCFSRKWAFFNGNASLSQQDFSVLPAPPGQRVEVILFVESN